MPFRHVVMFQWADTAPPDHLDTLRARLDALPPQIEEIRSYRHGADVGIAVGNYDYAVVAEFDDLAGFLVYRDHPDHVLTIEEVIKPHTKARAAVQFQQ